MNDMLVKYFKGKLTDCKISARTVISNIIDKQCKTDIPTLVTADLHRIIAAEIMDKPHRVALQVQESPEYHGKQYTVTTYCLSPKEFETLVNDVFNMGLEAARDSQKAK